jgi:hypothetical protein
MVRFLSQLLALVALLLASLPASAAAAPREAAAAAGAEHCERTDAGASQQGRDDPQEDGERPCCKNTANGCCPIAAPTSGSDSPSRVYAAKVDHRTRVELLLLGTSDPPLTEPPTFA